MAQFKKGEDSRRNLGGAPRGPRNAPKVEVFENMLKRQSQSTLKALIDLRDSDKTSIAEKIRINLELMKLIVKLYGDEREALLTKQPGKPKEPEKKKDTKPKLVHFSSKPLEAN